MTDAAIPYVVGAALGAGWILGAEWLRRRYGVSFWATDDLVRGVICVVLIVPLLSAGHQFVALGAAGLAVVEFAGARRNWPTRRPRDLLERNRLELENGDAPAHGQTPRLSIRGWLFIAATVTVWTLLEHWGMSYVSAGLVAALIGIALFRPWRRSPQPAATDTADGVPPPFAGAQHAGPPPFDDSREHGTGDGAAAGRGFEFTLSGWPAKLLGRALDRIARSSDASGE